MKVSLEISEKEVNEWLDYKKITQQKRDVQEASIKTLINSVAEGSLSLNDDKTFVHELLFPVGKEATIKKFEYKPRVNTGLIQKHMEGSKSTDFDARICATIAALTVNTKEVVKMLDTEDYSIASSIAIFFL
jgi:hypothetical protein